MVEGGRVVDGLTRDDFQVFDEGQLQKIEYFGHDSEPVSLVLLLDVSGSMKRFLEEMAAVSREALRGLKGEDRVAVMLFSRRTEVRQPFTDDLAAVAAGLKAAVREQGLGSGTLINPSILEAVSYVRKQAPRPERRAILIVSDNQGLNYQSPDEDVIRGLYEADTVLNAIIVGRAQRPQAPPPGRQRNPDFTPADVFRMADETGGEAVRAERAAAFGEMIDRLRTRYSLHYRAPEAASEVFRRIRVELAPAARHRRPRALVRARAGYFPGRSHL